MLKQLTKIKSYILWLSISVINAGKQLDTDNIHLVLTAVEFFKEEPQ